MAGCAGLDLEGRGELSCFSVFSLLDGLRSVSVIPSHLLAELMVLDSYCLVLELLNLGPVSKDDALDDEECCEEHDG